MKRRLVCEGSPPTIRLYEGDCLEIMPQLAENSIDAVVADPPYGVNLAYNSDFDDSPETWYRLVPPMITWALEREITCIVFGASPTQTRDLAAFPQAPQRTLIWSPAFSLSKSQANGMFFRWHPIYCWNLPARHTGPGMDILRANAGIRSRWKHPGMKPLALMRALVQIAPVGSTVLDPFMGTGTTGVACIETGRDFVGIEIDPDYFAIAGERVAEAQLQPRLQLEPKTAVVQSALDGLA